ncbi:MAG: anhydro-N-acetylmuramic acid kinase [Vitreoscilla sp.]|nr:anhydro-N-acetylmuramic acid kinase [Burkholderiales bacterium]MBP6338543.1 anhydro-N-acetylmuramic acid kinase [Vitreoscilla sp.]
MLTIGLMSGTSLDGVDGVLARFDAREGLAVLAHVHHAMPSELQCEFLALNNSGVDELHRAALAGNALARLQAMVVADLLVHGGVSAAEVRAIGSHGQTVRHRPGDFDATGYTLQVNQPALLAELAGIDVVADFRSRDVAAGGQGAPLVPAFHAMVFGHPARARAILNLGGIGNLTLLPATDGPQTVQVRGFDCGPGNALLDHWVSVHQRQPFDADGRWAAGGIVKAALLAHMLDEPFLRAAPPKSTGRDLFNPDWLAAKLAEHPGMAAQDVQSTLAEFTATTAAQALLRHGAEVGEVLVCGGGALNRDLMRRLAAQLPGVTLTSTASAGLPPMQVEAAAFAWLALAFVQRHAGNLPAVTGAEGPRVLGALYPAH